MYTDSINQFNGMSVVSGLSNVCICSDAIGDPKEIIIPNGFNPLTDNYIAIKAVFLNGHNAVNDSTYLTVKCKYSNGDYVQDGADIAQIPIMANKDGTLINIPIHTMDVSGTTTYKVLQPNTVLEMYYDPNANGGNGAFVVIGNPIVLSANDSNSSYTVYANGFIKQSFKQAYTGGYHNYEVTLPISFSDTNYFCHISSSDVVYNSGYSMTWGIVPKTSSTVNIEDCIEGVNGTYYCMCYGY